MKTPWRKVCRRVLGLSPEETKYTRRGFRGATDEMRARLERVGEVFLNGYHLALEEPDLHVLAAELNKTDQPWRGFAFEGAAMGLALLDWFVPWGGNRIKRFLEGPGDAHAYMIYVGAGWMWARLPVRFRRTRRRMDPLLSWLSFDGWGFHEGFFHWPKYIAGQPAPKKLNGYERRMFDQGLGRSLWFVNGGNPEMIARTIGNFATERQGDLWSGIGLAATYAGVASESDLNTLRSASGTYWRNTGQGAAFASKARHRAGNLTDYTDLAAKVFCGLAAEEAAQLCDSCLKNMPADEGQPAYEVWRLRIQRSFAEAAAPHVEAARQGDTGMAGAISPHTGTRAFQPAAAVK